MSHAANPLCSLPWSFIICSQGAIIREWGDLGSHSELCEVLDLSLLLREMKEQKLKIPKVASKYEVERRLWLLQCDNNSHLIIPYLVNSLSPSPNLKESLFPGDFCPKNYFFRIKIALSFYSHYLVISKNKMFCQGRGQNLVEVRRVTLSGVLKFGKGLSEGRRFKVHLP